MHKGFISEMNLLIMICSLKQPGWKATSVNWWRYGNTQLTMKIACWGRSRNAIQITTTAHYGVYSGSHTRLHKVTCIWRVTSEKAHIYGSLVAFNTTSAWKIFSVDQDLRVRLTFKKSRLRRDTKMTAERHRTLRSHANNSYVMQSGSEEMQSHCKETGYELEMQHNYKEMQTGFSFGLGAPI